MSRHRDIRNMDYSDEYDGYDDVYGHSVDDDFYISPSNGQYLYNRENSTRNSESDIKEEDEVEAQLSDMERAKLESCLSVIKNTLGPTAMSRNNLVNIIVTHKFNIEEALNVILENTQFKQIETVERKDKDVTNQCKNFVIPKLNGLRSTSLNNVHKKGFSIPKITNFNKNLQKNVSPKTNNFIIPKLIADTVPEIQISKTNMEDSCEFNNLSELVSNHLNTAPVEQTNFVKSQVTDIDKTRIQIDINKTTNDLANLQVSDSKSMSSIDHKNNPLNDWHIDLSVALKTAKSLSYISGNKHQTLEKFDIPFVDCEEQILPKKRRLLKCKFDIHNILMTHLKNQKCKSRFARALCKNYKRSSPEIMTSDIRNLSKLKTFNFDLPSPDDLISSHLKR